MKLLKLYQKGILSRIESDSIEVSEAAGKDLSLMASELLPSIRDMDGLCTQKFHADLVVEGLGWPGLEVGARLAFGAVVVEITKIGKTCYPECPICRRGRSCGLPDHVAFAKVLQGGTIRSGVSISMETR